MKLKGASYGVVPGNGNPKSDDKTMIAGPGHIIPAENAHVAKKIVSALGYNPNVNVDMQQGLKSGGPSIPIKISSKEYFMNNNQVDEMKNKFGIDPEVLSPNSDYNQRVNGGTSKQVENMINNKLFGMMNGGRSLAYQNGGDVIPKDQIGYRAPLDGSTMPENRQAGVALFKNKYGDKNRFAESYNYTRGELEKSYAENPYMYDAEGNAFEKSIDPDNLKDGNRYVSMHDSAKMARALNKNTRENNLDYQKVQRDAFYNPDGAKVLHVPSFKNGGKLSLKDLAINNSNQYTPYQNGGPVGQEDLNTPPPRPDLSMYKYIDKTTTEDGSPMTRFIDDQGRVNYTEFSNNALNYTDNSDDDWKRYTDSGYVPEYDQEQLGNLLLNPDYRTPEWRAANQKNQLANNSNLENESNDMPDLKPRSPLSGFNPQSLELQAPNSFNSNNQLASYGSNPNDPNYIPPLKPRGPLSESNKESDNNPDNRMVLSNNSKSPEDKHLDDLIQKSKDLENQEVAANMAMGLWNLSRERQPLSEPVYMSPSFVRRDYESMKNDMRSDLERAERRGMYQAKQLGMGATSNVGITANTQENLRKGKRSIWDMQQADMAGNVGIENQSKSNYQSLKFQRDMADANAASQFQKEKGQAMADNVREIFGTKEAGLYRTGELDGIKVNRDMDQMDQEYNSLDKQRMKDRGVGFISRDQYYKMSPEEKKQLNDKLK